MSDQNDLYSIGSMFRMPTHDPTGMSNESEAASPEEQLIGLHLPLPQLLDGLQHASPPEHLRAYQRLLTQQSFIDGLLERVDSMVAARAVCGLAGSIIFELGAITYDPYGDHERVPSHILPTSLDAMVTHFRARLDTDSRLAPMMAREETARVWGSELSLELGRNLIHYLCTHEDVPVCTYPEDGLLPSIQATLEAIREAHVPFGGRKVQALLVVTPEMAQTLQITTPDAYQTPRTVTHPIACRGQLELEGVQVSVWVDPYLARGEALLHAPPEDGDALTGRFGALFVRDSPEDAPAPEESAEEACAPTEGDTVNPNDTPYHPGESFCSRFTYTLKRPQFYAVFRPQ